MIAVAAATGSEIRFFLKRLRNKREYILEGVKFIEALLEDVPVITVLTGVGINRSRSAISVLLKNHGVDLIISAGFAGSLRQELNVGDIMVGKSVCRLEGRPDEKIQLYNLELEHRRGVILTSSRFISSSDKKAELSSTTSADCIDMESWSVAKVAYNSGVHVIGIRAISDDIHSDLPELGKLFDSNTTFDFPGAIRYFFKNPVHLYTFCRFMYIDSRKAATSLSRILTALIPEIDSPNARKN